MRRWALKLIVLVAFLVAPLWLAALAFDQLNRNQVTYRYIADALDPLSLTRVNVAWSPSQIQLARPMTEADEFRVGLALTEAWQALAAAQVSGSTDILKARFTGVALERATQSAEDASAHGGRIAVLSQAATPIFFHKDGSMMQVEVEMLVARYVVEDSGLAHHQVNVDTAVVTLFNHTSGWRVFSHERIATRHIDPEQVPTNFARLQGVNYYPANSPWTAFWPNFDPEQTLEDFERVLNLNGNTVRIFLPYAVFLEPEQTQSAMDDLRTLLQIAESLGINVIPTLFDLKPSFGPGGWANDILYLENVLPILAESSAVAFVDLKNEADLDFAAHGTGQIQAWLRSMRIATQVIAPDLPVTVGWSSAEFAGHLSDSVDVITYHDFGPAGQVRWSLDQAKEIANGRPVVVTEIGTSSYNLLAGLPGSSTKQARHLTHHLAALENAEGVLVWTLFDFPEIDAHVIGGTFWRRSLQAEYGLFNADGNEKPAARVVRAAFAKGDRP